MRLRVLVKSRIELFRYVNIRRPAPWWCPSLDLVFKHTTTPTGCHVIWFHRISLSLAGLSSISAQTTLRYVKPVSRLVRFRSGNSSLCVEPQTERGGLINIVRVANSIINSLIITIIIISSHVTRCSSDSCTEQRVFDDYGQRKECDTDVISV